MFDIRTAKDFHAKLIQEFDAHIEDRSSSRHAINCALTAFHMVEWVWADFLKHDDGLKRLLRIKTIKDFRAYIDQENPCFITVQGIATGSKHFQSDVPVNTHVLKGFGRGGFGEGGYGQDMLVVDVGTAAKPEIIQVTTFLELTVRVWTDFLNQYGPYQGQLKKSKYQAV